MTKVVFMGTPQFAVPILRSLLREYTILAVVTQSDKPKGRQQIVTASPVKCLAIEHDIPVLQPKRLRGSEELQQIIDLAPDIIITAAYGQILPDELLAAPAFGCINVHASLLPKYRGGAPIHHALINGEEKTGITIMYMVSELDAGDIISQESIAISPRDDVGSLHDKLSLLGANLLRGTLPDILSGKAKASKQIEEEVTYAYNISRKDEQLIWSRTARELFFQVRGLRPWPVAFTNWRDQVLKIWSADYYDARKAGAPGEIIELSDDAVSVATGSGVLQLYEVQPSGKKRMSVADFQRGYDIRVGETFE